MKKPNPKSYGFENELWQKGGKEAYELAVKQWKECRKKYGIKSPGRQRIYDIHPSWLPYVAHFDPTNPERSQGAFCRWAGLSTSYVSSAKNNPITEYIEFKLLEWIEEKAKEVPIKSPSQN